MSCARAGCCAKSNERSCHESSGYRGGALGIITRYESPQWEKMSIAALHARTDAISRELSEHKGILEQMQTPKARTDARNQFVEGKVREVVCRTFHLHLRILELQNSARTTRLQSSTVSVMMRTLSCSLSSKRCANRYLVC